MEQVRFLCLPEFVRLEVIELSGGVTLTASMTKDQLDVSKTLTKELEESIKFLVARVKALEIRIQKESEERRARAR